jgi:hypothetical protein
MLYGALPIRMAKDEAETSANFKTVEQAAFPWHKQRD